jgi:hypothetical protein
VGTIEEAMEIVMEDVLHKLWDTLLVVVLLWRLLHWHCILLRRRLLLDQRLMLATILRVSGRRNIVLLLRAASL